MKQRSRVWRGIAGVVVFACVGFMGPSQNVQTQDALESATGGGWILGAAGEGRATFGLSASRGTQSGHVLFIDHSVGFVLVGTVTFVTALGCEVEILGEADTDFGPVSFMVNVIDNDEPGFNGDHFTIVTSAGYVNSSVLQGGNIQVRGGFCFR